MEYNFSDWKKKQQERGRGLKGERASEKERMENAWREKARDGERKTWREIRGREG